MSNSTSKNDFLSGLLDDGLQNAPTYEPSKNSDHLPMALTALAGLSASEARILRYKQTYQTRLHQISAHTHSDAELSEWQSKIGEIDAYGIIRTAIGIEVECFGTAKVLNRYLPKLLATVALEAFHPLIRLAYGLLSQHQGEIVNALAYWLSVHDAGFERSADESLDNARNLAETDLEALLIGQSLAEKLVFKSRRFGDKIEELQATGRYPLLHISDLANCAQLALELFRSDRGFFSLHLVTATHAARICLQHLVLTEDRLILTSHFASAMAAAHLALASPKISEAIAVDGNLDLDHQYKYVFSCQQEYEFYGDPRYFEEIAAYKALDCFEL